MSLLATKFPHITSHSLSRLSRLHMTHDYERCANLH